MKFISASDIYTVNQQVVGHEPIVLNRHLLQSAAKRPYTRMFGQEAYPSILEKAASLVHALAHDHLFTDGNKRTAQIVLEQFLHNAGYRPTWNATDAYHVILEIAKGKCEIPQIVEWLAVNTAPV
ncbi:MAG TPA: type II toxin-antitoxin system death-on-curing family toxin [Aggregatilineales bacterium]|nr:type II toxin-antitoxin system death-on-curing family toxin [Aggregatilineales bacterium]